MSEVTQILSHSLMITAFVFTMMMIVDYINVLSKGRMGSWVRGGSWRQYSIASFLGATPGCLGAFMNVSFYIRGLLSFGAMVGGMIATSGDEAFVMLALFPVKALGLFGLLFVLGIIIAWLTDKIAPLLKIRPCEACQLGVLHYDDEECRCFEHPLINNFAKISFARFLLLTLLITFIIFFSTGMIGQVGWDWQKITLISLLSIATLIVITVPDHYLEEHIWQHIGKRHIWRVFLWTFAALLIVNIGLKYWNLDSFVQTNMGWILLISGLVGLIPESGPHLIFVIMFSKGLIPFSVLLASSIVQDGHGMLPLLSYTVKDSILIKLFNLFVGLTLGAILYCIGW